MSDAGPTSVRARRGRTTPLGRRAALGLCAGALGQVVLGHNAPANAAEALAQTCRILVAGPAGGRLEIWATLLAAALQPALPAGTMLQQELVGGEDGVTGANQFATRVPPDGNTLMLAPGDAVLAWLSGDKRAHHGAARWLAVAAGVVPAVVVARVGLAAGQPLRVGMAGTVGRDLAALLGLELAGFAPTPVFGVLDRTAAGQALAGGAVDAVLLRGGDLSADLAALATHGAAPIFALPAAAPDGVDRAMPELADFIRHLGGAAPAGPLYDAWRGVAAAAQTEFALVLPALTAAPLVALWRQAASQAADLPELRAAFPGISVVPAPAAIALTDAMAPDAAAIAELRAWLAVRLNWRPA